MLPALDPRLPATLRGRDQESAEARSEGLDPVHAFNLKLQALKKPESGSLTSLQFCCAGWLLTRGRELSGERPRTLI